LYTIVTIACISFCGPILFILFIFINLFLNQ
jgi:hypothetical protein